MLSAIVIFAVGLKNTLNCGLQYVITRYAAKVSGSFGAKLLQGIVLMPYEWHLKQNSADLVTTFAWRDQIGNGIIRAGLQLGTDFLFVSLLLVTLLLVNPMISIVVICFIGGAACFIFQRIRPGLDRRSQKIKDIAISANKQATQIIHGIKDIKLISSSHYISNLARELHSTALDQAHQILLTRLPYDLLEFVGFFILCGAIVLMNLVIRSSSATITGTVTLLAVAAWRVLPAINRILMSLSTIRTSLPTASRILEHLILFENQAEQKEDGLKPSAIIEFRSSIAVSNLSFTYNGGAKRALSGVSFTVEKGETIGIIGPSGAGKSTLVDILIGLLKPSEGEIVVDGVALTGAKISVWMRQIGYVPQTPYIRDDSLSSNVAFGEGPDDVNRELVLECCRMANVDVFLDQLPEGIDTRIGERGVRLSGGQRQRVAIARALYRKSNLIVFDEATSALDTKSEREIQKTMENLRGRTTMIVIAHRLSTVKNCDRILWLEKGRVKMFDKTRNVIQDYVNTHESAPGPESEFQT
jgi:ABC-type bacteriocin/lantibiotic exporter with double-glycine peptidase domain